MDTERFEPFKPGLFELTDGPDRAPRLIGVRCQSCGRYAFPARDICIFCHSGQVERTPLSSVGVLHTFTVCGLPVPRMLPPYAMGYVDLPEGVRVFAQLEDWREAELEVGMQVELCVGPIKTGEGDAKIVSYKFRPKR
ncbi:MAG: OB-fold domain-containing protein [Proteobacteria bacterium]|nr:OB-fold domain-containing protein [Pseudomonadota bacterium]